MKGTQYFKPTYSIVNKQRGQSAARSILPILLIVVIFVVAKVPVGRGETATLMLDSDTNGLITLTYAGILESSDKLEGPYTDVVGASSPFTLAPQSSGNRATFYRTRQDPFIFGGNNQNVNVRVDHSTRNQQVLIGVLRAKWSPDSGSFAVFEPGVAAAFDRMNNFWDEASFAKVSFTKQYLSTDVIQLTKSKDYYYHHFQQRKIVGSAVNDIISFPSTKTILLKSDGDDVTVTFPAGPMNQTAVTPTVVAAIAAKIAGGGKPPTVMFSDTGTKGFAVQTTLPGIQKAKLEIEGDGLPYLGFGAPSLYNLGDSGPPLIIFSASMEQAITVASSMTLEVKTLGQTTTANIPAGNVSIDDIVTLVQNAFPGEPNQQPFKIESLTDPSDGAKRILVFKSRVSGDNDHGFTLTVGGTAISALGLTSARAGLIIRYEPETFKGYNAIQDGFSIFASSLPAGTDPNTVFGNARMFVGIFVDDDQFRAHHSATTFNLLSQNFDVDFFAARISDSPGPVFAHETGHSLSFPDLYHEDGFNQIGTEPGLWDLMDCSRCDPHPVTWLKSFHHQDPSVRVNAWIDDSHIAVLNPVPGGNIPTQVFLLTPDESPWITSNPFAGSNPGIQVVHSVELVPTDSKDVYVIENRQKGMYRADQLGPQVDFSTDIPSEGIILYQGRRLDTSGLAKFLPVNLITPMFSPLDAINTQFSLPLTSANQIKVKILDKLTNPNSSGVGNASFTYKVQVDWGVGSFFDLAIRPWSAPPYESPDIWIDNRAQNDWDVYTYHDSTGAPIQNGDNVALNQINRLYARVTNLGDIPVTEDVTVIWSIAVPQMAGGNITTELGRIVIPGGVPGHMSVVTPPLEWVPTSDNHKHVCIKAEIVPVPGERNETLNNSAQENFTQWFSGASSPFKPVTFEFQTQNPVSDRDIDVRIDVPGVPRGWTVAVQDVSFRLKGDEVKTNLVSVAPDLAYFLSIGGTNNIPSFAANVQALTPIHDDWVPIGGLTAIVHPVNERSRIQLSGFRESRTLLIADGTLTTTGPLQPPLANREINIKLLDNGGIQFWKQAFTDFTGRFRLNIPVATNSSYTVQAFFGGGAGINAAISNPVNVP